MKRMLSGDSDLRISSSGMATGIRDIFMCRQIKKECLTRFWD